MNTCCRIILFKERRTKDTCKESKYDIDDHFALYHKMVDIGSKVTRNYKNI